jgi:hypothetical protein
MIPIDSCQNSSCPDVLVTAPFMGLCDGAILEFPLKLSNNLSMNRNIIYVTNEAFLQKWILLLLKSSSVNQQLGYTPHHHWAVY